MSKGYGGGHGMPGLCAYCAVRRRWHALPGQAALFPARAVAAALWFNGVLASPFGSGGAGQGAGTSASDRLRRNLKGCAY
jgi:hypothetical protein